MSKKPPHKQKQKNSKNSCLVFGNNLGLSASLDLHHGPRSLEEVSFLVDRFLVAQRIKNLEIIRKIGKIKLGIIVGSGNNSKRLIDGKNPLRYFVESYLAQTDILWHNDLTNLYNLALIIVELE